MFLEKEFCYCIKKSDLWKLISVSTVPHLSTPILSMSYRSTPPARLVSRLNLRKPSRYASPYTRSEDSQPIYQLSGYWHVDFTHIHTHKMAPLSLNSYWHLYRIDELQQETADMMAQVLLKLSSPDLTCHSPKLLGYQFWYHLSRLKGFSALSSGSFTFASSK